MSKGIEYIGNLKKILTRIETTQKDAIAKAGKIFAECLSGNGMIYAFGTGHSHMLAEELFYRAGGLVRVYPILDEGLMLHAGAAKSTGFERLHGYAEALLANYPVKAGDVIVIASNSGRNPVSIEMAQIARKKGMKVIIITNMAHSRSVTSRHESGGMLYELGDVVIDNCGCVGDASIDFNELGKVGPTSTSAGTAILHAIVCEAVELMLENGIKPEVFCSSNVDGGDEINDSFVKKYSGIIKCL